MVKMYKNVKHAKVRVQSCKCIKWVQVCINKFKKIVTNAKVKVKLLLKEANVNNVTVKKYFKRPKKYKFQYKKVHRIIIQLICLEKEIKSLMLYQVIWFSLHNNNHTIYSQGKVLICLWKNKLLFYKRWLDLNLFLLI